MNQYLPNGRKVGINGHGESQYFDNTIEVVLDQAISNERDLFKFKVKTKFGKEEVKRTKGEVLEIEDHIRKKPLLAREVDELEKDLIDADVLTLDGRELLNRLDQVDRFLNKITSSPLFWTPEVLVFLGVKKSLEQQPFLEEHMKFR